MNEVALKARRVEAHKQWESLVHGPPIWTRLREEEAEPSEFSCFLSDMETASAYLLCTGLEAA